jgi:hypothetical protein
MAAMQACAIVQHANTTIHRTAARAYLQPDVAGNVTQMVPYQIEEQALMNGNVPQPEDWLRAWRLCRTTTSFAAAEATYSTEHIINPLRKCPTRRRAFSNMVVVMAEVLREEKRKMVRRSMSISIGLDDRKDYRLIRFRCDRAADAAEDISIDVKQSACFDGVIAVVRPSVSDGQTVHEQDKDKGQKMADSVVECIRRLCTPAGQVVDEELVNCVLNKCRHTASDQGTAAQKCTELLAASVMPNVIIVGRDPAHQCRIAARDPLHGNEEFRPVWDKLFGGRHAVVPDLKNSEAWRSCLVACQKRVLELDGSQGGALKTVLRHLAFAQQRFESYADPVTRFCCMIKAIAWMLAIKAADVRRNKEERARASSALRSLTAEELMGLAVSADYAEETVAFLRHFDKDDHDPAKTRGELSAFAKRMRLLFCDGHILTLPPRPATVRAECEDGEDGEDGPPPMTATQLVWEQVEHPEAIVYGSEMHFLCTRASVSAIKKKMQAMCEVVDLMLARMDADLGSELSGDLDVFDLAGWAPLGRAGPNGPAASREPIHRAKLMRLTRALKLDRRWDVGQFCTAARGLVRAIQRTGEKVDNRVAWSWLLRPCMRSDICPQLQWSDGLCLLIAFYVSMAEGTGKVERQLGRLVDILTEHEGPLAEDGQTASAILEVYLDGPKTENALFHREEHGQHWCMGAFGRACQALYIRMHGRRFSYAYQKRKPSDAHHGKTGWHVSVVLAICVVRQSCVQLLRTSTVWQNHWYCVAESLIGILEEHWLT